MLKKFAPCKGCQCEVKTLNFILLNKEPNVVEGGKKVKTNKHEAFLKEISWKNQ